MHDRAHRKCSHLLSNAAALNVHQMGLEERFAGLEALGANLDDATIGQSVRCNKHGGLLGKLHLAFRVVADVAKLLLDLSHLHST